MPVYLLGEEVVFPCVDHAEPSGLLAVGGDLSPERLLVAYRHGIFPWYSEGEPILWFSPDPRMVLDPTRLRLDRGVRRTLRTATGFHLRLDTAFDQVVHACASAWRPDGVGTWITPAMIDAYRELHHLGWAHSAEAWSGERLVGGVYGVSIGRVFYGESMFRLESGASLAALVALVGQLARWDFAMFDCQLPSALTARLGAVPRPRRGFLETLEQAVPAQSRRGPWSFDPGVLGAMLGER